MADLLAPAVLEQYRRDVDLLWRSAYLRYPRHVHIETLTLCPAACEFCPYPTLERKGARMSDELIDKIIADLVDIPRHVPIQLSPFLVNDPFVDRRIFEVMRKANHALPNARLTLTTSGAPLTASMLDQLLDIENVGYLWISLNEHRPEAYEKLMQLPWERTLQSVKRVHDALSSGRIPFRVVLSRVADGTVADDEFCAWVAENFPGIESRLFNRNQQWCLLRLRSQRDHHAVELESRGVRQPHLPGCAIVRTLGQ